MDRNVRLRLENELLWFSIIYELDLSAIEARHSTLLSTAFPITLHLRKIQPNWIVLERRVLKECDTQKKRKQILRHRNTVEKIEIWMYVTELHQIYPQMYASIGPSYRRGAAVVVQYFPRALFLAYSIA